MASEPEPRPSCSTAPCCARGSARAGKGRVTFLLDRVAEDMAERLQAVTAGIQDAADIWTPGDQLRNAGCDRFASINSRRICRIASREAAACAGIARPRGLRAGAFSSSTICPACWRRSAAR
jgi:hypothetical protein